MLDQLPLFLTVPEAGHQLRIGRSKAYELTVEWERTDGKSGLPFVWFGSQKRVPRAALTWLAEKSIPQQPAG